MKISSQHAFDVNAKFSNQFNVDVYKDTLWKASQYPFAATQKIKYKILLSTSMKLDAKEIV